MSTKRPSLGRHEWRGIVAAFGGRCAYCGVRSDALQAEHMGPFSRGGATNPDNIVPACAAWNAGKSNRTVVEWLARVRRPHRAPPAARPPRVSLVRIQKLREAKGWTQAEPASRSGVPQSSISRLESGQMSVVNLRHLEKLAAVFKVKPSYLIVQVPRR